MKTIYQFCWISHIFLNFFFLCENTSYFYVFKYMVVLFLFSFIIQFLTRKRSACAHAGCATGWIYEMLTHTHTHTHSNFLGARSKAFAVVYILLAPIIHVCSNVLKMRGTSKSFDGFRHHTVRCNSVYTRLMLVSRFAVVRPSYSEWIAFVHIFVNG